MKKIIIVIVVILILAGGAWYAYSSGVFSSLSPNTIALVNGEKISQSELEEAEARLAAQQGTDIASLDTDTLATLHTQVLNALISQKLLEQTVKESGISATQEDVDVQINAIKKQLGSDGAFAAELSKQNLTEAELREQISTRLATDSYLTQTLNLESVTASEEEINAAYVQSIANSDNPPRLEDVRGQVETYVILQKQQSLINQLIEQLREGADVKILI